MSEMNDLMYSPDVYSFGLRTLCFLATHELPAAVASAAACCSGSLCLVPPVVVLWITKLKLVGWPKRKPSQSTVEPPSWATAAGIGHWD